MTFVKRFGTPLMSMSDSGMEHGMTLTMDDARMTRREAVRKLGIGTMALAVTGLVAHGTIKSASANEYFRTTTALNLRAEPNTSARVLLVIPSQGLVTNMGSGYAGFLKVSYQGTVGFAAAQYLEPANGGSSDGTGQYVGKASTTSSVNLRYGPGTSYHVIKVLPAGAAIDLYSGQANGFRYVVHAGHGGWVYADYISTSGGGPQPGYKNTTTALNMRSQPNTSASVILVVPAGASVRLSDQLSNGYRQVTYSGKTGWVLDAYLR
jgi:uncharacterized protein YraI